MSTTTMHFGPEWMRTKHQPTRSQPPPSPPPSTAMPPSATYSALLSNTPPVPLDSADEAHPFRYTKDDLLHIYQEGGGKGALGIEVERWEGVVREVGIEPISLREMSDVEKKLFSASLNSDLRRRPSQSTDLLSPLTTTGLERPRILHTTSANAGSPMRERYGGMKRRDSSGGTTDLATVSIPRKPSLSTLQAASISSPREISPRARVGYTSNFDGVLNNGESWVARRRASEASLKSANTSNRDGGQEQALKASGIREEKEAEVALHPNGDDRPTFPDLSPQLQPIGNSQYLLGAVSNPSSLAGDVVAPASDTSANLYSVNDLPPPGLSSSVPLEWSYKDPTGQVQGPFSAELMQKWFKEGYFTPDLPMKRSSDSLWITVQELVNLAGGTENAFLVPLPPLSMPNRGSATMLPGLSQRGEHAYQEPFQPAPIRSLRTSALESYVAGGSLPSDSPSSSFSASHLGNPSPDPGVSGKDNRAYYGGDVNGRSLYGHQESPMVTGRLGGQDFSHEHDSVNALQGNVFTGFVQARDMRLDGRAFGNQVPQDSWGAPSTLHATGFPVSGASSSHIDQSTFPRSGIGRAFNQPQTGAFTGDNIAEPSAGRPDMAYSNQFDYTRNGPFNVVPDPQSYPSQIDFVHHRHGYGLRALEPIPSHPSQSIQPNLQNIAPQSPWSAIPEPSLTAATTLFPEVPDSNNTPNVSEPPSQPAVSELVSHSVTSSHLTVSNLGQHDRQQDHADKAQIHDISLATPAYEVAPEEPTLGSTASADQESAVQEEASNSPSPAEPTATVTPTAKAAWATQEEGKKKKAPGTSISLREIQEAEAKKHESKKVASREKERIRSPTTTESKEDTPVFTASWGLPTSQAGNRGAVPLKEVPAPATAGQIPTPTSTTTTAVWMTPVKTTASKKSMKEIQEEEEKRKRAVVTKESNPSPGPRRGYAETTTKMAPASALNSNNAWTTVGPHGKSSTPIPAAGPTRAPPQSSVASSAGPRAAAAPSSARPAVVLPLKPRPASTKPDEISESPSHDFLKWLSDSLKNLNSSANIEEIMSMLLSFPLEADSSTLEIISDTIYANSTTLDGRRFASEFVTKRKADASARAKASTGSNKLPPKPVSIADVVKAVPKPTQPEWGFKVVNKKKKGGRS